MDHLYLGCTKARHAEIGIHAVINARGSRQDLNDLTPEDIELMRDADHIHNRIGNRVRFYQFNSRFFRRNQSKLQHLLSSYND